MNKEEAITIAKTRLTDYVSKVTTPSRGRNMYVCPLCKSGTGKNGSGAFSVDTRTDRFKCFSCNKSGDIFDLYSLIHKTDYPESVRGVCNELGIYFDDEEPQNRQKEAYSLDWNDTIGTGKEPQFEENMNLSDYLKTELEEPERIRQL